MCVDFVREGTNGIFLNGQARADGETIMALLDDQASGMAALDQGAFASAAEIPSWDEVMTKWHQLYDRAQAV
jgi:hypothetical protein